MSDIRLDIANKYIAARLNQQNDTIQSLVTDDITVVSSRDGTHTGRPAFTKYLESVAPTGKWETARIDPATNDVVIDGKVKVLFVNWNVTTKFEFNSDKISRITIARA